MGRSSSKYAESGELTARQRTKSIDAQINADNIALKYVLLLRLNFE